MEPVTQIILTAITAAAGVLVALVGRAQVLRSKRVESEAAPYSELARRVDHLEEQVGQLFRERHEDRNYIRRLLAERPFGLPIPRPAPSWLDHPEHAPTPSSIIEPPRNN
ncbi:hypothetical protein ACTND8_06160 [Atopobiaceae bacterium HCP3S3_F7]|uniref:hypothetical protein n=1 Tax=unclassified Collinsella TaxID=2637548 RepID=UPI003F911AF4